MRAAHDEKPGNRDESDQDSAHALAEDGVRALAGSASSEIVSSLLSSARHDLRSPLQSIQGFAELLESEAYGGLSDQQHTFVEHIVQGSLELGSMLDACLELTELALAEQPLALQSVELSSTLLVALERARSAVGFTDSATHKTESVALELAFALPQQLRTRVHRDALQRALVALTTALTTSVHKQLRAELTQAGEQARLRLTRLPHTQTTLLPLELLVSQGRTRSLIWWQLATLLLARQGIELLVGERLDCAELRFALDAPH